MTCAHARCPGRRTLPTRRWRSSRPVHAGRGAESRRKLPYALTILGPAALLAHVGVVECGVAADDHGVEQDADGAVAYDGLEVRAVGAARVHHGAQGVEADPHHPLDGVGLTRHDRPTAAEPFAQHEAHYGRGEVTRTHDVLRQRQADHVARRVRGWRAKGRPAATIHASSRPSCLIGIQKDLHALTRRPSG